MLSTSSEEEDTESNIQQATASKLLMRSHKNEQKSKKSKMKVKGMESMMSG